MEIAGLPKTILLDLIHKYRDGTIVPDLETLKTRLKYREFAGSSKPGSGRTIIYGNMKTSA
jgi:hypothetical protein